MVPSRNYIQTVRQFISKMKPPSGFTMTGMTSKWAGRRTDGWIETYHRWKGLSLLLEEKEGSLGKKTD